MNPLVYIGHPGHELRIFDWLCHTRPEVWAITDGSGSAATSRVQISHRVLAAAGLTPSPRFGQLSDKAFYNHILSGNPAFFIQQVEILADAIISNGHDLIVSDAIEGYSTTHDLCNIIAAAAARLAATRSGRLVAHYDFPLIGDPGGDPARRTDADISHRLDDRAVSRKIEVALEYGRNASPGLLQEVEETIARFGTSAFSLERLFVVNPLTYCRRFMEKPYYETYGEKRAAEGCYDAIIRHDEHMIPLADIIETHAAKA